MIHTFWGLGPNTLFSQVYRGNAVYVYTWTLDSPCWTLDIIFVAQKKELQTFARNSLIIKNEAKFE